MQIISPAKINLWLQIHGKRLDGFHEVRTRFCKLALADTIEIERVYAEEKTMLSCSDPFVPTDESNLVMRALRGFEEASGVRAGWRVHLEKRIPSGAGLGGGSSNAATALKAFNAISGSPLSQDKLLEIAASIGSDVPFFLLDKTAADGTGRGEIVAPAGFPFRLPVVLIKPPFPIPTPWAYKRWTDSRELAGVLYAPQICAWGTMFNDLERPVFEKNLLLPAIKSKLLEFADTTAALMSGSGSTIFAITHTAAASEDLAKLARGWLGDSAWIAVTHTLPSGD